MNGKVKRLLIFTLLLLFMASALKGVCADKPLKIGFIMVGPATDFGYNYAHDQARLYVKAHLKGVETTVAEKVPESAEVERVMEKMIAQGNKLIFSTSYGYLEPAERVAKRHPDVIIMQPWRPSAQKNMGCYSAYQYEPLYAVGMVAGKMTRKNSIGMVCSHPIPNVLQMVNSFTLGVRSVNPKAKIKVVWTNSWSDPTTEAEASRGLIDSGVDVIGCVLDSPITVVKTCEQSHVMVFGTHADAGSMAPNEWLTGSRWNWDALYLQIAKSVEDGTWKKTNQWLGMKDGAVALCQFGKIVPKDLQNDALAVADQIKQGKKVVYIGPLKDREGKQRLAAGQTADAKMLSEMDWFVEGVDGALPKK